MHSRMLSQILEGEFGDRPLWFSEGEFIPRGILPISLVAAKKWTYHMSGKAQLVL